MKKAEHIIDGKEIKLRRQLVGLKAEELAERVGVSRQTIAVIENNHGGYSPQVLRVIQYELTKAFIEADFRTLLKGSLSLSENLIIDEEKVES